MPVEEFGGGPRRTTPKQPKPNPVATRPGGRAPAPSGGYTPPVAPPSTGSSTDRGQTKKSGSSTSSTAKKVTDPYAAAQAAATASANRSYSNAANRYSKQAKNLEAQARALKSALNKDLKKGLLQQLSDINQSRNQQGEIIREGFRERMKQLRGAAKDNDKAAAQQSTINQLNQIRERNSALSEAMAQGAGESDSLQAMMMSLRNWNANASEIERGYFDTLRSIKSSQTDLEVDTKTALMNNQLQANADKEQLWTNYYNQRSELYTQLGNTRGQQADYYAMANEARANIENAKAEAKKDGAKAEASAKAGAKKGSAPKPAPKQGGGKAESGKGGVAARALAAREVQPVERPVLARRGAARDTTRVGVGSFEADQFSPGADMRVGIGSFEQAQQPQQFAPQSTLGRTVDVGADEKTARGSRPPRTPGGRAEAGKGGRGDRGARNEMPKGGKGTQGGGGKKGGGRGGPGPLKGPGNAKVTGVAKSAKAALKQSRRAFMQASKAAGRSWNNPGVSDAVMEWDGADPIKAQENNLNRLDTVTEAQLERKKPEGASLRRWS